MLWTVTRNKTRGLKLKTPPEAIFFGLIDQYIKNIYRLVDILMIIKWPVRVLVTVISKLASRQGNFLTDLSKVRR